MFLRLQLADKELLCFEFEKKWYLLLAEFCDILFSSNNYFEYLLQELIAYEKSLSKTKRKSKLCFDTEIIANYIEKNSNNCVLLNGKITCSDAVTFRKHCALFEKVAVDFRFFCEYLQQKYKDLSSYQHNLTITEFCTFLTNTMQCPFWAFIFKNLGLLEHMVNQYLHGKDPQQKSFSDATDQLLEYLNFYQETNKSEDSHSTLNLRTEEPIVEEPEEKIEQKSQETEKEDNAIQLFSSTSSIGTAMVPYKKPTLKRKRLLTKQDKIAIAADQHWKCQWCSIALSSTFHVDHIDEFSQSGNDHHTNLWALCHNCHAEKTELDRKRKKPHIWGGYEKPTASSMEKRSQQIINKISSI